MRQSTNYHPQIPGPDLAQPFQVQAGIIAVFRLGSGSLVIPAGGAWPGLDNLPEALIEHLQLYHSLQTPDALVILGLSAADLPAAKALVLAQALTSLGASGERLQLSETLSLGIRDMNRTTASGVLGMAREQLSMLLRKHR